MLLSLAALLAAPAAATGTRVVPTGLYAGVLTDGELDAYPGALEFCPLPAIHDARVTVALVGAQEGDVVALWTYRYDSGTNRIVRAATLLTASHPVASADTTAFQGGCPRFDLEGRSVGSAVGYVAEWCVPACVIEARLSREGS